MQKLKTIFTLSKDIAAERKKIVHAIADDGKYLGEIRWWLIAFDNSRMECIEREDWDGGPGQLAQFVIDHQNKGLELSVEIEADVYDSRESFKADDGCDDKLYADVDLYE